MSDGWGRRFRGLRRRTLFAGALLAIVVLVGRRARHLRGARALPVRAGGGAPLDRPLRRAACPSTGHQRGRARPGRDPGPPGLSRDAERGRARAVLTVGERVGDQRAWRGPRDAGGVGRAHHPAPARRRRGPERRASPRAPGQRRRGHGREHPPGAPARRPPGTAERGPGHRGRALLRARRRRPPRHRARAVDECPEGPGRRGREHHHPAARQEPAAQPGAHARPQDQRGAALDRARVALHARTRSSRPTSTRSISGNRAARRSAGWAPPPAPTSARRSTSSPCRKPRCSRA